MGLCRPCAQQNCWRWREPGRWASARNLLVINDEAHHAWRVNWEADVNFQRSRDRKDYAQEAMVSMGGLDRLHRTRAILTCCGFSTKPGTYRGEWQMCSDEALLFGDVFYVQIVAFNPSAVVPATATAVEEATVEPSTPSPLPEPAVVCDCSGGLYNCADFATQGQAQACHEYCIAQGRGAIRGLDGSNDGDPCESLK